VSRKYTSLSYYVTKVHIMSYCVMKVHITVLLCHERNNNRFHNNLTHILMCIL